MPHRFLPYKRTNTLALIVFIGLVWSVFFGLLIYRAYAVASTDEKLCRAILHLVNAGGRPGGVGTAGLAYYRSHPAELRIAQRNYDEAVRTLDCSNLQSGTKLPSSKGQK